jgi:hypothetical protein
MVLGLFAFVGGGRAVAASEVSFPPGLPEGANLSVGPGHKMWFEGAAGYKNVITPSFTGYEYSTRVYFGYFNPDGSYMIVKYFPALNSADFAGIPQIGAGDAGVFGPDGNFWILGKHDFVRTTPAGVTSEFPSMLHGYGVERMVDGPGGDMYFTTEDRGRGVGRLSPSGAVTMLTAGIPGPTDGGDLADGPGNRVWFTPTSVEGELGSIGASGRATITRLPHHWSVGAFVEGADGNLWGVGSRSRTFGEVGQIARITPSGHVTGMCRWPKKANGPMVAGPDRSLWFPVSSPSAVERVDTHGNIYMYRVHVAPSIASEPTANVVPGPEGDVWLNGGQNAIRVNPSEPSTRVCRAPA